MLLKISDEFGAGSPDHARSSAQHSPGLDSESGRGGRAADRSGKPAQEEQGNGASGPGGGVTEILAKFVEEISSSVGGLIDVYSERARLSVRRAIARVAIGLCVAVCASVWLGASSLAILRGICGGLTTFWGGREWMGDLTGGLIVLMLVTGAIALHLSMSSRRELARLRTKYEQVENEHS
jgi:hypothetical protein